MAKGGNKTIKVNYLARVEGEGALTVRFRSGQVEDLQLKIFEPPRFFEAFLRGRSALEVADITARICGICPIAYQMSAVYAVEQALGVTVEDPVALLRRLLYCGEWIESHALHVYMLHAPDYLGYPDVVAMAKDYQREVERGLAIKKAGNAIVAILGGREIHPINVRVGGFYRLPLRKELDSLLELLHHALDAACDGVRWVSAFTFTQAKAPPELVALQPIQSAVDYPMCEGRIISSSGINADVADFERTFEEIQVPYSNALHSIVKGGGSYLTGPLARFHLHQSKLTPRALNLISECGSHQVDLNKYNPSHSIIIRSLEIVHALDTAIAAIKSYEVPAEACKKFELKSGTGMAATEAPRGLLYHRYCLDADGRILDAKIVPPTSQNQRAIEDELRMILAGKSAMPKSALSQLCEQAIRNHDPCISCATHFLKLNVLDLDGLSGVEGSAT